MSPRATLLAAVLLVASLAVVAATFRFGGTLAFTLALAVPATEAWRGPFVQPVAREEIAFAAAGRTLVADLYRPARPRRATLLVHGLSTFGRRQPDLARFARLLAAEGQLVLVPDFPGLIAFRLGGREVEEIGAALDHLATLGAPTPARPDPAGPLAIAGFSFGAGPALLAAAERPGVRLVASFGGYADLRHVIAFITTGAHAYGERRYVQRQEEYNRWKLLGLLVGFVEDTRDRAALDALSTRKLANPSEDTGALETGLGVEGRSVLALVRNGSEAEVAPLLTRLSPRTQHALERLSPLARLGRIRARLLIAHGAGDDSIPFTESLRVAEAAGTRAVILETFHHTGPTPFLALLLPRARDASRLARLADALLRFGD
ncbi:MAG: hypothetical protein HYU25_00920 [Candidatus Rokubacteria bacterium]|nr:hypothetical protein [Candidatus Rokubacteria bacterium]